MTRELEFVLEHPNFWRAALRKGATDQTFWQEFRELGRQSVLRFIERHAAAAGPSSLSEEEIERIRFAFQMVRGTLNNTLMNQPGPFQLEDPVFRRQMERAFPPDCRHRHGRWPNYQAVSARGPAGERGRWGLPDPAGSCSNFPLRGR